MEGDVKNIRVKKLLEGTSSEGNTNFLLKRTLSKEKSMGTTGIVAPSTPLITI